MSARQKLFFAMAGLTMMALPVGALAGDNHHNWNRNFSARPAIERKQSRANFSEGGAFASNDSDAYAWNHHDWGQRSHNGGNWLRNSYPGWNSAPPRYRPITPPVYSYGPPAGRYVYNPPCNRVAPPNFDNGNYGYGNGYGGDNGYGYGNPINGDEYGYGNGYQGGNLVAERDRLLRERAGAFQQLAIREHNGDSNGAHHLWNTIHSLNEQLGRVNAAMNHRG